MRGAGYHQPTAMPATEGSRRECALLRRIRFTTAALWDIKAKRLVFGFRAAILEQPEIKRRNDFEVVDSGRFLLGRDADHDYGSLLVCFGAFVIGIWD